MSNRKSTASYKYFFCMLLLFLFNIYFFRLESVLLLSLFAVVCFIGERRSHVDIVSLILLTTFVVYTVSMVVNGASLSIYLVIRSLIGPFCAYYIGRKYPLKSTNSFCVTIAIIAIANSLYGILNVFSSANITWIDRSVSDFWGHGYYSATLQGSFFIPSIAYAMFLLRKKGVIKKALGILLIFVSIYSSIVTSTRFPIIIVAVCFILSFVIGGYLDIVDKKQRKKFFHLLFFIVVIIIMIVCFYTFNVFNIKTTIESSNLVTRLNYQELGGVDSRITRWMKGLTYIFQNPLGYGNKLSSSGGFYAHNLWIDFGIQGGLFPMILLVMFSIIVFVRMVIIIFKNKRLGNDVKTLVFALFIAYYMNFMIEPIFTSLPFFFISFCIICGLVGQLPSLVDQQTRTL